MNADFFDKDASKPLIKGEGVLYGSEGPGNQFSRVERTVDIGTRNRAATRSAKASRHSSRWSSSRVISAVNSRSLLKSVSLAACSQSRRQSGLLSFIIAFALRNRVSGHNLDMHVKTCASRNTYEINALSDSYPRCMRSSKTRCRTKLSLAMRCEEQTIKRATNTGISYRPRLAILPKTRHVVDERALRIGASSAVLPVMRPASTQAYGCKHLMTPFHMILKLIRTNCCRRTEFTVLRKPAGISKNHT